MVLEVPAQHFQSWRHSQPGSCPGGRGARRAPRPAGAVPASRGWLQALHRPAPLERRPSGPSSCAAVPCTRRQSADGRAPVCVCAMDCSPAGAAHRRPADARRVRGDVSRRTARCAAAFDNVCACLRLDVWRSASFPLYLHRRGSRMGAGGAVSPATSSPIRRGRRVAFADELR